jgi:hypothetical protein
MEILLMENSAEKETSSHPMVINTLDSSLKVRETAREDSFLLMALPRKENSLTEKLMAGLGSLALKALSALPLLSMVQSMLRLL